MKPKGAPPISLDEAIWRQARAMEEEAQSMVVGAAGPTTPKTAPARAAATTPQRPPSRRMSTSGSHDNMDNIISILPEQRDDTKAGFNDVKQHFDALNARLDRRDAEVDGKLADM